MSRYQIRQVPDGISLHADRGAVVAIRGISSPRTLRRLLVLLMSGLLLMTNAGCNWFLLASYLIGGPPQIEPRFEAETRKSMTDKDIRVVVLCYAAEELQYQYDSIDHILSKSLSIQLAQHKIDVVSPDLVRTWLEQNQDWDSPTDVGSYFDVNYVIYVDISDFSLYEMDSNATLFRGRCEANVTVYEMEADGEGSQIFTYPLNSAFPTEIPRSAAEISYESFRMEYYLRLSDEIGRLFYPYLNGDDISAAT